METEKILDPSFSIIQEIDMQPVAIGVSGSNEEPSMHEEV